MLESKCRGTCTGTLPTYTGTPMQKSGREQPIPVQLQPVPVHLSEKVPVDNLYRYSTNLYRNKRVRVARIEKEFESNARAHSSFNNQCGITMEKGIKAKEKREKAAF